MSVGSEFRRRAAMLRRVAPWQRLALLVLCLAPIAAIGGASLAQDASDQQMRCIQLQQELSAAQNGGGGQDQLPAIQSQIQQVQRVYQGTKAAMEDANCFQSFFIFGRSLVRSPRCLKMNDRMEDAERQLDQLQQQRDAMARGGGNQRQQADLQDALARNGCGGQPARRGGGGILDWFGGNPDQQQQQSDMPISRSIIPNVPYRTVCVRLCDGFFYPINYSTYSSHFSQDATECQSNCAAPAELYVYRNPGEEIDQAISLNGAAYKDLPVAFKYRKSYTKGCSCKQVEYNPTEIEQSNRADMTPTGATGKPGQAAQKKAEAAPRPQNTAAMSPPANAGGPQQLDLNMNGSGQAAEQGQSAPPPGQQSSAPDDGGGDDDQSAAAPSDGSAPDQAAAPQQSFVTKTQPAQQ